MIWIAVLKVPYVTTIVSLSLIASETHLPRHYIVIWNQLLLQNAENQSSL